MIISSLSVQNVRSHDAQQVKLAESVTVITGKNGIGKTTLLEAIYIALQGSSFKGADKDILRHETPWYRIDLTLQDDSRRTVTFDPSKTSGKKRFIVDEKTTYRLMPGSKYPVVLFEPEDLRLLHGSPARRRQFLDHFIAQIDPMYGTTLRKYERALKQRNTLLKSEETTAEDLFVWNIALSEYGEKIIAARIRAVELINEELNTHYKEIAHTDDQIKAEYSCTVNEGSAQKLLRQLEDKFFYDKVVKHTSTGPHRHDVQFLFNNSPALSVASRGEVRTVLLALKQIEARIIERITEKKPIILLDDVFSELDADRQGYVGDLFSGNQVVISSATSQAGQQMLHVEL